MSMGSDKMQLEKKKITKKLTEGNIYLNLLLYALPLITSHMLTQAYSTVDGIIAGKFIGEFALGSISATSPIETLVFGLFQGFALGFSIYISHLFGKGDFSTIKRDVVNMIMFIGVISVGISVLLLYFQDPLMNYLNVDAELREEAKKYFTVYTMGYVIFNINQILVNSLHALGITFFSMYVSLMSAFLNIGGNLLMVLVFNMGVEGLAISTLLSSLMSTVVYSVLLRRAFRELGGEKISYRFDFSCVKRSFRYSAPAAIQQISFHGVSFIISPSINILGAAATTGYNVCTRLHSLCTTSLWGISSAFACYTGQSAGEGNTQKIRRGVRIGFWMTCLMILPFVAVFSIFGDPIASMFFPNGYEGEALSYAVRYAHIYLPFAYIQLIQHFYHTYMRSLGQVSVVLGITVVGSIIRIVGTLLLTPVIGLDGAFLAQFIGWAIDSMISFAIYFFRYRTDTHLHRVLAFQNSSDH